MGLQTAEAGEGPGMAALTSLHSLLMQDPGALPFPFPDESLSRGHIPVNCCHEWGHQRLQEPVG